MTSVDMRMEYVQWCSIWNRLFIYDKFDSGYFMGYVSGLIIGGYTNKNLWTSSCQTIKWYVAFAPAFPVIDSFCDIE